MKFSIGQRVKRRTDVYNPDSDYMYGTVVKRYDHCSRFGYYPELYAVIWDEGKQEKGFLPHGLHEE